MFEATRMLFLYGETPLHAGTGSGLGAVDLPVQRERATGYPLVQASSLKGVLRAEAKGDSKIEAVFGPDTGEAHKHAGALSPGDARLLLFPVRSLLGVFAWTTSAHVLARFLRDAEVAGLTPGWDLPEPAKETALVPLGSDLVADGRLVLEEFAFTAQENAQVQTIADWLVQKALPEGDDVYGYWQKKLPRSLVILPEDDFREFVHFSTEVVTRVQLDSKTKTVAEGPWTEENLPTDTLLYAPVFATKPRTPNNNHGLADAEAVLDFVENQKLPRIQLGGNETIGRGIVALRWAKGGQQ